jgi:hypothetical protein
MDFASEWMSGAKPITTFHWTDCKPIDFFGAFFSDSSKFQEETHRVRGDKNCSCERWAPSPMGFHSRVRKFSTGYKTPLGEMGSCRMKETQRVKVLQAATTVLMVNTMNLAGVPYAPEPPLLHSCCARPCLSRALYIYIHISRARSHAVPCIARGRAVCCASAARRAARRSR